MSVVARGGPLVVGELARRPRRQQQADHVQVAADRGEVHRRLAGRILVVDLALVLKQQFDEVDVARERGELQWGRLALLARRVHVGSPLLQQHARDVVAALVARCRASARGTARA